MSDVWVYLEQQGYANVFDALVDVIDMPEQDSWTYDNPIDWCVNRTSCVGPSMVCNVFVAEVIQYIAASKVCFQVYKHAGVFGDLVSQLNTAEMVPRDLYQLNIYNSSWVGPAGCSAEGSHGYCQLLGNCKWRF